MRLPKLITAAWLLKKGACKHQVMRFQKRWPDGAEITAENLRAAWRMKLDFFWFVRKCLPKRLTATWRSEGNEIVAQATKRGLSDRWTEQQVNRLDRDTILRAGGKAQL